MIDKTISNETQSASKKERFEFKFTVNGNIICQRYFRINGFKREAYGSLELIDAIETCVDMINRDLRDKTHMFLESTAPSVFDNKAEMEKWIVEHPHYIDEPHYFILKDSEDVYVHADGKLKLYDKPFNRNDYIAEENTEVQAKFKFSFLDNGVEVAAKAWDGMVYPKFIRTNVDLSNSKNKYKQDGIFAPIEYFMMDAFIETKKDLIPRIVAELCNVCTYDDVEDYTTKVTYGTSKYNLDIGKQNWDYIKSMERKYRKKTNEYFNQKA